MEPSRRCIAAIVAACRRLSMTPVRASDLFDLGEKMGGRCGGPVDLGPGLRFSAGRIGKPVDLGPWASGSGARSSVLGRADRQGGSGADLGRI
jgi:hypothetical protein